MLSTEMTYCVDFVKCPRSKTCKRAGYPENQENMVALSFFANFGTRCDNHIEVAEPVAEDRGPIKDERESMIPSKIKKTAKKRAIKKGK